MFILEDKIYLHFQKTGGFSVYDIIKRKKLKKVWFKEHHGIVNIPEEYKHLRRFSFIRNPFDWYVSFFFFHENIRVRSEHENWLNPFLRTLTSKSTTHFNDFIIGSCNLKDFYIKNPDMHKELINQFKKIIKKKKNGWIASWFAKDSVLEEELSLENLDITLMDWYLEIMGLNEPNTTVYRIEEFEMGIVKEFGNIEKIPHKHKSRHSKYQHYYNEETIGLVNDTHKSIMDNYNYDYDGIII